MSSMLLNPGFVYLSAASRKRPSPRFFESAASFKTLLLKDSRFGLCQKTASFGPSAVSPSQNVEEEERERGPVDARDLEGDEKIPRVPPQALTLPGLQASASLDDVLNATRELFSVP